jgi:LmbE family N-acetylglucosaminyl deacetylase
MRRTACITALALALYVIRLLTQSSPPQDRGATGTWQKLLKLRTTASVMHTTAHPDDEHGGMLAIVSRGEGARLSLLTLTRGESGDNAIGPELFDGLGLIRTEELLIADKYYGVDHQYFTPVIDYGFSKRLDEALEKWGKESVLRDIVRVIRMDRPLVLISRFQGNQRDGHGNHQAAGLITQEAWQVAGDPHVFPEQVEQGLRPWQPVKLYIGGVRENEEWTIRIDAGEYSPALGDSFNNFARFGLSFQRSQNSGRFDPQPGPWVSYYKRLQSRVGARDKEETFFDSIDTHVTGIFGIIGHEAPASVPARLQAIENEIEGAFRTFAIDNPAAVVPSLARGLRATRAAIDALASEPEAQFLLKVKEQQFQEAINTALGLELIALAQLSGTEEPGGPVAELMPSPVMGPVVPGQTFDVRTALTSRSHASIVPSQISLESASDLTAQRGVGDIGKELTYNQSAIQRFTVRVADDAKLSKPYFSRDSIQQNRYAIDDATQLHRPARQPALTAVAKYTVDGTTIEVRQAVQNREAQLPYGYAMHELKIVPVLAVNVHPRQAIIPLTMTSKTVFVNVELLNNKDGDVNGTLALKLPDGWRSDPPQALFAFRHAGEKGQYGFTVLASALRGRDYRIEAVATSNGREYREGYDVIDKRDLETIFLYHPAHVGIRGIDVKIVSGLTIGYVMGVGDDVPGAIAQLGAKVTLLGQRELASDNLQQYDAIVTGTRAYAVREDLRIYKQRLLDYVRDGGNLIVLYNTEELNPKQFAPYPGELTARAEEVSEEDSPVEILAPDNPVFKTPNVITKADFANWVEQRGSKFWSSWDKAYTPMIATWDKGQQPQQGGWLHARHGKGHYTYFAYALHRQLPYSVPGAYRLLANLLSLGKGERAGAECIALNAGPKLWRH